SARQRRGCGVWTSTWRSTLLLRGDSGTRTDYARMSSTTLPYTSVRRRRLSFTSRFRLASRGGGFGVGSRGRAMGPGHGRLRGGVSGYTAGRGWLPAPFRGSPLHQYASRAEVRYFPEKLTSGRFSASPVTAVVRRAPAAGATTDLGGAAENIAIYVGDRPGERALIRPSVWRRSGEQAYRWARASGDG